jgi:hypothetical protein
MCQAHGQRIALVAKPIFARNAKRIAHTWNAKTDGAKRAHHGVSLEMEFATTATTSTLTVARRVVFLKRRKKKKKKQKGIKRKKKKQKKNADNLTFFSTNLAS